MLKHTLRFRPALVLVFGLSLLCSGVFAQGHENQGDRKENNRGDSRGEARGDSRGEVRGDDQGGRRVEQRSNNREGRYHYRDGRWYGQGWFGWEFAVSALAIGAMVESLPPNHTIIVVGDTSYYYDNSRYYRQLPDGAYVVVQSPR